MNETMGGGQALSPPEPATVPSIEVHGFCVGPSISQAALDQLRHQFALLGLPSDHDFHASCNDAEPQVSRRLHSTISSTLREEIPKLLERRDVFLSGFVSKGRESGPLSLHQDLSYTDERVSRSEMLWIPLVDVDESTGALRIVAGSHRWTRGTRPALHHLPTEAHQRAFEDLSVTLTVAAGTVIRYDAATIHGSHPNHGRVRPAVGAATVSSGSQLIHCLPGSSGELDAYQVDSEFYLDQSFWSVPQGYAPVPPWAPPVHVDDFSPHLPVDHHRQADTTGPLAP